MSRFRRSYYYYADDAGPPPIGEPSRTLRLCIHIGIQISIVFLMLCIPTT